jgi:hypothetical protein
MIVESYILKQESKYHVLVNHMPKKNKNIIKSKINTEIKEKDN